MWTFPILLDHRPGFLSSRDGGSLLLAPLGHSTVLGQMLSRLRVISGTPPVVVTTFAIDPDYERAVREWCPAVEAIVTQEAFHEHCGSYQPSDRLVIADPTCFPVDEGDPAILRLKEDDDPRWVRHLVALDRENGGTREYLDSDTLGRVRAIQRFYDSVTWPFVFGVGCSLIPAACLQMSSDLPVGSLPLLRRVLSTRGVPSRDLPIERGSLNLGTEGGLLAANEQAVLARSASRGADAGPLDPFGAAHVHPGATISGPVVLHEGALVEEGATVIGPSVLGAGSRVESGATVAQCVVGRRRTVPAGTIARHRVIDGVDDTSSPEDEDEAHSWNAATFRLAEDAPPPSINAFLKRAGDVVVAAVGLVVLAPVGLLIAALVKLESRGPVHFAHLREGVGGRPFRCWKFRTMIPDADVQQRKLAQTNEVDGPQFKIDRDPRRTRLGRILTASNLDEIPQLWNVLVGEMSLVGPRPSPFRENQICVPWREARLSVRPGITGLWQVCRHDRDEGDFHQWVYYDLLYVQHLSFWLDLKIVVATFLSMARGGSVPLEWVLPPEAYGERRKGRRDRDRHGTATSSVRQRRPSGPPAEAPDGRDSASLELARK